MSADCPVTIPTSSGGKHNCNRGEGHRARSHRCACGATWWEPPVELNDRGSASFKS